MENSLSTYEPHACVVVYSVVDRNTFKVAEDTLNYLWRENVTKEKAVIVVGNKADLARARQISTAGKPPQSFLYNHYIVITISLRFAYMYIEISQAWNKIFKIKMIVDARKCNTYKLGLTLASRKDEKIRKHV